MAHDAACKETDEIPDKEIMSLINEPHDHHGVAREICLEAILEERRMQLEADATQHQLALLNEDDQPGKLLEGPIDD